MKRDLVKKRLRNFESCLKILLMTTLLSFTRPSSGRDSQIKQLTQDGVPDELHMEIFFWQLPWRLKQKKWDSRQLSTGDEMKKHVITPQKHSSSQWRARER